MELKLSLKQSDSRICAQSITSPYPKHGHLSEQREELLFWFCGKDKLSYLQCCFTGDVDNMIQSKSLTLWCLIRFDVFGSSNRVFPGQDSICWNFLKTASMFMRNMDLQFSCNVCFWFCYWGNSGFVKWVGRREWQPAPVLLPGKSHGRRRLVGCSPWGC